MSNKKYGCVQWEQFRKFTNQKADFVSIQTKKIKQFLYLDDESLLWILTNPLSLNLKYKPILYGPHNNAILNRGRLTAQKGQDLFIKVFRDLNNTGEKLILVEEGIQSLDYENHLLIRVFFRNTMKVK